MELIQVIVLICNVAVAQADCSKLTATDYFYGPEAHSTSECMRSSTFFLAALAVNKAEDEYQKILCQRVRGEEDVGGGEHGPAWRTAALEVR